MDRLIGSQASHERIHIHGNEDVSFILTHDPGSFVPLHWHLDIELIFLLSGQLAVLVSGQDFNLGSGDILLVNSKTLHQTKCTAGNQAILLQIPYPFLKKYIPDVDDHFFRINSARSDEQQADSLDLIRIRLMEMKRLREAADNDSRLLFTARLFELLHMMNQNFKVRAGGSKLSIQSKNLKRLEKVFEYSQNHYREPITIPEISNEIGLQPEYFCRFFKKHMGMTYLAYLNDIRLSHIYQDLILTDCPICHLLEQHGYSNTKGFRRLFRQHFNKTPTEIRQEAGRAGESYMSNS